MKLWARLNDRVVVEERDWPTDLGAEALAWWRRLYFMDAKRRAKVHLGLKVDMKAAHIFDQNRAALLAEGDIDALIAMKRLVLGKVGIEKGSFVRSYDLLSSRKIA